MKPASAPEATLGTQKTLTEDVKEPFVDEGRVLDVGRLGVTGEHPAPVAHARRPAELARRHVIRMLDLEWEERDR